MEFFGLVADVKPRHRGTDIALTLFKLSVGSNRHYQRND